MRSSFFLLLIFSAIGFSACDNLDIMKKKSGQSTTTSVDSLTGKRGNITIPIDTNTRTITDPLIPSEKTLIGTWRFVSFNSEEGLDETTQEIYRNARIEFTHDGRYISSAPGGESEQGTYRFDTGYGILQTTDPEGKLETCTVEWIDGGRIKLTFAEGDAVMERVR